MNLAKKTVFTNTAKAALNVASQNIEDAIIEMHINDNDKFAIGDVKLSARNISDPNWLKCDGDFLPKTLVASLPTDVLNTLVSETSMAIQPLNISFGASTVNSYSKYVDDNYFMYMTHTFSSGSSGGVLQEVVLHIYNKGANSKLTFSGDKTLASRTATADTSFVRAGGITKCGNYYYASYCLTNTGKLNWYVSYTTDPTGTWTNVQFTENVTSDAGFWGIYSDGTNVRLDLLGGSSYNILTSYTSSGTLGTITTTTQTLSTNASGGVAGVREVGNGGFFKLGPSSNLWYKSSLSANWELKTKPSWSYGVLAIAYTDSKWWGFYSAHTTPQHPLIVIANTLADLFTGTLSNLTQINIDGSVGAYYGITYTNKGLLFYQLDEDGSTVYLYHVSQDSVERKNIGTLESNGQLIGILSNSKSASGVACFTNTKFSAYTAIALPGIEISGVNGYMKIADNHI